MNKIFVRGLVLFIIVAVTLIFIFFRRSPFGSSNSSFAVQPGSVITRIDLSGGGEKLTLEKNNESWLINGKAEARKSGINFIIRMLTDIKIKSPVSAELYKTEISDKNVVPVKVKVYGNHRLLRSFLVYKTQSNVYGNIMKVRESAKPFIVYIPGYEGDVGSGFIPNDLFWENYTVFNLLPSEIASVKFDNFPDTAASFSIINKSHRFILTINNESATGCDSSLVIRYISYFARVPFESWALTMTEKEKKETEARSPIYRISVTTTTGKKQVLTLWPIIKEESGNKVFDSDRLLGRTDAKDELFIIRYFDIDPLIKKRSYFYP
jgi:hypothetical protein